MDRPSRIALLVLAWVPAALVMAVIFWRSAQPGEAFVSDPLADMVVKKVGHFVGYAALGVALALAIDWSRARSGNAAFLDRATLLGAWAIAATYAATDELHQVFVPGRSPSIVDVGIDALGAAAGIALFASVARWWTRRRTV